MFVKQRRTHGWSSYLPGKNIFIPQQKSSNLYIIHVLCEWKRFWVCIYAHCSIMRSQMLYTRGSFEICQERMFVKQRRKHSWSSYLLVALTELWKNIITHIVPRKKTQNFIFAWKIHTKFCLCCSATMPGNGVVKFKPARANHNMTCYWSVDKHFSLAPESSGGETELECFVALLWLNGKLSCGKSD